MNRPSTLGEEESSEESGEDEEYAPVSPQLQIEDSSRDVVVEELVLDPDSGALYERADPVIPSAPVSWSNFTFVSLCNTLFHCAIPCFTVPYPEYSLAQSCTHRDAISITTTFKFETRALTNVPLHYRRCVSIKNILNLTDYYKHLQHDMGSK